MLKRHSYDDREGNYNACSLPKQQRHDDHDKMPDLNYIFNGEVASVTDYGVFIKIPGFKKQGLVHKSQMSNARIDDPSEMLSIHEKVYCKVIAITDEGKISLSMKSVNQTNGKDLDPNNIQLSIDERKKKKSFQKEIKKIELGAVYNTVCKKCGGHGHFAKDCFSVSGKVYDLIPDLETQAGTSEEKLEKSSVEKKKRKKEKKSKKKHKKKEKRKHKKDSPSPDMHKTSKSKRKKKSHHTSSDKNSSSDSSSSSDE